VLDDILQANAPPPPGRWLSLPLVEFVLRILIVVVRLLS
jgi:hypothetical protein